MEYSLTSKNIIKKSRGQPGIKGREQPDQGRMTCQLAKPAKPVYTAASPVQAPVQEKGMRIFGHLEELHPGDFIDLVDADTGALLGAQASTAAFLASLGEDSTTITSDQLHNARTAFAAVTNPNSPEADKRAAILALRVPPAVQHLAGMLSEYDWAYVEQAKELRGYVVAKLLEETKHPDARIRLRALELTGKLTEVGSFTERSEVVHKNASADEIEEKIRARLKKYLPPVLEVETVQDLLVKSEAKE